MNYNPNEIVSRASSGRALRGISFTREQQPVAGKYFLIDPPSDLWIMGPNQAAEHKTFCFSGAEQSESFCKDVKEKGWTTARSIHADKMIWPSGWASLSGGANTNFSDIKLLEACITECAYVPTASFKISADAKAVKLSQHALIRARGIKTDADAHKFLREFHPFLFTSMYHLGGAYFRQISVKCKKLTALSQIMEQLREESSQRAKLGTKWDVSGAACGSSKELDEHPSFNQYSLEIQQTPIELFVCGDTSVKTEDEFIHRLKFDKSSWAIIDRDLPRTNTLLSVWDLVLEHSNAASLQEDSIILKRAAKLLCRRWIISNTSSSQDSDDLNLKTLIIDAQKFLVKLSDLQPNHQVDFSIDSLQDVILDPEKLRAPLDPPSPSRAPPGDDDSFCFHYVGDVIADRNFYKTQFAPHLSNYQRLQYAARRYIDCLRHRVNPAKHLGPLKRSQKTPTSVFNRSSTSLDQSSTKVFSPLQLLIYIFQHSDLPTRIEICRLLLLQRASTLLVFPSNLPNSHNQVSLPEHYTKQLWHCIDALGFVSVPIENQRNVCIAEDISLLRLAFISDKDVKKSNSATLATRLLVCKFVSQDCAMGEYMEQVQLYDSVIEVAVGFAPDADGNHTTCIALHVTGSYEQLLDFIAATADVVIIELEKDKPTSPFWPILKDMKHKTTEIIQWKETDAKLYDHEYNLIMGPEAYLVNQIGTFIGEIANDPSHLINHKVRSSLQDECAKWFNPNIRKWFNENVEDVLDDSVLKNIRKRLKLQKSLEIEAQAFFESMKVKDSPPKKNVKDRICFKEKERRVLMAKDVIGMPILQRFHHLLSQTKAETRIIQIMSLERALGRKMQRILANVSKKVDKTYEVYNSNRNNKVTKKESWEAYTAAKQEYVDKSVGLENLWRELSLIFEADPDGQNHLAQLAAQYLIDGFPLEIYDGDAGIYRKTWVERVLIELDKFTTKKDGTPARFFVLSVMGLQSSGKSTMLNLMFGTRLQTSAGRCTRGVYMQLVPSDREEYDYVILIDTEGIRSNDFEGLDEAEARDNRLATFGLLPADASILMVTNKDDRGLKEVLPMVLLAFSNSSVAEKSGGRMKTKMFFVYRSVDTNDKSKLKMTKQKLHDHLRDAAEEVSQMSANKDEKEDVVQANSLLETVFSELRVFEDESKSDVRCMGNLKRGGMPPGDTPEWSYGEAVINLREHIHQRVVSDGRRWEATNLVDWSDHLALVWKCICTTDFELSFRNSVEYNAYMQLQKALQDPRSRLNQRYFYVFLQLEREIREMKIPSDDSDFHNISTTFLSRLDTKVSEVVRKETELVEKTLEKTKWKKWHAEKLDEWESSCKATNLFFHRKVEDLVSGILKFNKILADSERSFQAEIVKLMDSANWERGYRSQEQKIRLFDEMFHKKLLELQEKHRRIAYEVSQRVTKQYSEIGITKELDLNKSSNIGNALQMIRDTFRGIKEKQKEKLLDNLNKIIDKHLDTAKQYSDVVVSQLVRETREAIDKVNMTKEEQEKFHFFVKDKLIQKMEAIQNEWDDEYNVAAKFMTKYDDLLCFFLDKAQGLVNGIPKLDKSLADSERSFKAEIVKIIDSGEYRERVHRGQEQKIRLFDETFHKKLLELQEKHPRIANEVSHRVTRQYSEMGITKELDLNKSGNIGNALPMIRGTLRGSKLKQKEKLLLDNLNKIIDKHLDTAKQYSDVVVSQLVRETREAIDKVNMTREEQENFHFFVKGKLIQRMEAIQNEWDEKHNVAAKFRTKKHDLLCFFLDKAQGLAATDILINDLQRTLKYELKDAFQCALIKKVASEIQTKDWLLHPQVLRKFLDYHLLILLDMEKINRAIAYVYDESDHLKTVVDAFIEHAITKDNVAIKEWEALMRKVNDCIPEAPDPTIQIFLGDLRSSLMNRVDSKLAVKVTSSMNSGDTYLKIDMGIYEKKVKQLRECLKYIEQPTIGNIMRKLVEGVKDLLEDVTNGNGCKTRCEARCPQCGSACFYRKGHDYDCVTSPHDCVHQPWGLCGKINFNTKELLETNCFEVVESRFDVDFKDWRRPNKFNIHPSIHIREYIFSKYQIELSSFLSSNKGLSINPCPSHKIPLAYNHDINTLKVDLKNKLQRITPNLSEIESMFRHLQ